jgi:quercetin dioxygenase-like cupin family protein
MRLFRFDAAVGHAITRFDSRDAVITGIQRGSMPFQLGCLHLAAGGVLGYHPATTRQLLLVVAGSGWVRAGAAERRPIMAGQAAYWEAGEEHETTADTALVAIILESDGLDPAQVLREEPPV